MCHLPVFLSGLLTILRLRKVKLNQSPGFGQGEVLLAGKIVPSPILAKFGKRLSQEGGSNVPPDWAIRK
jgi:hypothetical protein